MVTRSKSSSTRVKVKITGKFSVCEESSATGYGVFDCDFPFGSHEWSCFKEEQITFAKPNK